MTSAHSNADTLTNLALACIAGLLAFAAILRTAGTVAAVLTGVGLPTGSLTTGLRILGRPLEPGVVLGTPQLNAYAYWAVALLLLLATGALALVSWQAVVRFRRRATNSHAGTATAHDVAAAASQKALLKRSWTLRPSLTKPAPGDVGYVLGRAHGRPVWASVEDSMLVLGPPRSGKGLHLVVNAVLDAPGAVVTTSTRPDTLAITLAARQRRGPVAVFDPQRLAPGLSTGTRWSLVRGCEDPLTAQVRAAGLASSTGLGKGGDNGAFWEGLTRTALQGLLHAAALDGLTARELYSWSTSSAAAADAVAILTANPDAAHGWGQALDAILHLDPRTRDSAWAGVQQALSSLSDPRVLDAVCPTPDETFDPESFLRSDGTLYLLATGSGSVTCGPLVAAFIEDLTETARRLAALSPGARLDPPLLLALDEIGNLAPLPSLPSLMSDGGGSGITTMPVLQSLSQARSRWGADNAGAMWDAAIVKVILGGTSSATDLRDVSALIGERDESTASWTVGDRGARSVQHATRRVPVLPPEAIRTLPFGTGLVLLRSAPPIITTLLAWTARGNATELQVDRARIERELREPSSRRVNSANQPSNESE